MESYLVTSWQRVTFRVASTQEDARAKKEDVIPDFNSQSFTPEQEEVFLIKWRVRSYLDYS